MSVAKPTADDVAGMLWFNSLTEQRRAVWLQRAGSSRPVDAWRFYKKTFEGYARVADRLR